jgi:hypothetical protein
VCGGGGAPSCRDESAFKQFPLAFYYFSAPFRDRFSLVSLNIYFVFFPFYFYLPKKEKKKRDSQANVVCTSRGSI